MHNSVLFSTSIIYNEKYNKNKLDSWFNGLLLLLLYHYQNQKN